MNKLVTEKIAYIYRKANVVIVMMTTEHGFNQDVVYGSPGKEREELCVCVSFDTGWGGSDYRKLNPLKCTLIKTAR